MKTIFEKGDFDNYRVLRLDSAMESVCKTYNESLLNTTTVFISHKHEDLNELKGIIGYLKSKYNVKPYIDSQDPAMPNKTSAETAQRIKKKIDQCDKFILLATDNAIESKWCNWELGYGDATKYSNRNVALFPMKGKGTSDRGYKGNEYMGIYPHIVYSKGDTYNSGKPIIEGYYLRYKENEKYYVIPLEEWFESR